MGRTHYDTLGVSQTASRAEISAAFRELSKTTHPDIAGPGMTSRFQEISHAAGILTNPTKRNAYDRTLEEGFFSSYSSSEMKKRKNPRGFRPHNNSSMGGVERVLDVVFRPRNMMLGSFGLLAFVYFASYFGKNEDNNEEKLLRRRVSNHLVQAWKNPQSGHWEQPAPWDPLYRQLKPNLEYVPREQVRYRSR